jgi:hypothetical protein
LSNSEILVTEERVAVMLLEGKCNASNTNNVWLHFWSINTGKPIRFYVCEFSFISGSGFAELMCTGKGIYEKSN